MVSDFDISTPKQKKIMPQTHYQSFIIDNAVVVSGHILVYVKGIIIMPFIIKTVGATIYGGFALLTSIIGIAFGLSSLGAGFRAQRFMPSAKTIKEKRELFYPQFYFNVLTIVCISLLFLFCEAPLNTILFKNEISFSIWIVPLYLISYLLYSQGTTYFRYTLRINHMMSASLCFPYLHIGFILIVFYVSGKITIDMLVISMALSALVVAVPLFWKIFSEIGSEFFFYKTKSFISDIRLGFPLILNLIFDFVLTGSDKYFIAINLSVTDVGFYTPAYMLGSLIVLIPKAMSTVLPQLMSKATDCEKEYEAHRMLAYSLKIFMLLAIPYVVGCATLGKPILTLFANKEIAQDAYWVTPVIALGMLFYGLNIILANALFVLLRTSAMFKANLIAGTFSLLSNFVLFYFFKNIIVAAATTLFSYLVAFIYIRLILHKEMWNVDFQPVVILKVVSASLVMSALLLLISHLKADSSLVVLVGQVVLGIICYCSGLFLFGTFTEKEIQFAKNLFRRGRLISR